MMSKGVEIPYISDGLVFWLDGIEKGGTPDIWKNLVGNTYFPLGSNVVIEQNSVLFNGVSVEETGGDTAIPTSIGTIELCGQDTVQSAYSIYAYAPSGHYLSMMRTTDGFQYDESTPNGWQFLSANTTTLSPFSVSLNEQLGMLNGIAKNSVRRNENWSQGRPAKFNIGGVSGSYAQYSCKARIHSVRIYNRQLSQAEMLANQRVDNARFNLGLSI